MNTRIIHLPVGDDAIPTVMTVPAEELADRMHELCGGFFQVVGLQQDVMLWINEEGKLRDLPINDIAQKLWMGNHGFTDLLFGPVVLTGGMGERGETLGLTDAQLEHIERSLGMLRVRVENTYADGHESVFEYLVTEPTPNDDSDEDIEQWEDEVLITVYGDGHGADNPKLGSHYEATVLSPHSDIFGCTFSQD